MNRIPLTALAAAALVASLAAPSAHAQNLLKNGSFEGGARYWLPSKDARPDNATKASGHSCLRLDKGGLHSGPFPLDPARKVRVSFSARSEKPETLIANLVPSHREIAQRARLAWARTPHQAKTTTDWQRFSFEIDPPDLKPEAWWAGAWMVTIAGAKGTCWIDDVTVAYADAPATGENAYAPRKPIEILADSPDLSGYTDPSGNLIDKGRTITLRATLFNASHQALNTMLSVRVHDYDGAPLAEPTLVPMAIEPGKTLTREIPVKLDHTGLLLLRASVSTDGRTVLDSSDLPVTVLPYPKAATSPDWDERFGASFRGPHTASLGQKIGFRWTRWHPQIRWEHVQKDAKDQWLFPDDPVKALYDRGIIPHATLYSDDGPKWAFEPRPADKKDPLGRLPVDMRWNADDKRWDDLSTVTAWDTFVTTTVKHYAGRPIAWEVLNEPEVSGWDKDLFFRFTRRTAKLVKAADPKAFYIVNSTWAGPTPLMNHFFKLGGSSFIDAWTWHDYTPVRLGDFDKIARVRHALDSTGGKAAQIWFNEGWSFINSSQDHPAPELHKFPPPDSAHAIVRDVADMTAAGLEKTILFHLGYEAHPRSWWDYYPPGQELWDVNGHPTVGVAAWNVMCHHLGKSAVAGTIRPRGAALHVFDDRRNAKGVIVAFAKPASDADVTVDLPLADVLLEDVMGRARTLPADAGKTRLTLPKDGRPFFLYTSTKTPAADLLKALQPLDARLAQSRSEGGVYRLPLEWTDKQANPFDIDARPAWRLDRLWPDSPDKPQHFIPMTWQGRAWGAAEHVHAGRPGAAVIDGAIKLSASGPWGGSDAGKGEKSPALVFVAPQAGAYTLDATAEAEIFDGKGPISLLVIQKDAQVATTVRDLKLQTKSPVKLQETLNLGQGQEVALVVRISRANTAAHVAFKGLTVTVGN